MKVIGAGFGRTGTTSLKVALEQLGFAPCYHMQEVIKRPRHTGLWQDVWDGKPAEWEEILGQFPAGVDYPICNYYKELLTAYPEAKVILSVREPEKWYESTLATIYQISTDVPRSLTMLIPPFGRFVKMTNDIIWDGLFDGRFEDKARAIQIYRDHIEDVKRHVPAEKLLIFHVREGWEPLCAFLEVPAPERPFPHVNERAMIEMALKVRAVLGVALPLLLTVGGAWIGILLWRQLMRRAVSDD